LENNAECSGGKQNSSPPARFFFGDPWFLSGLSLGFLGAFSFSPQQGDIK